MGAYNCCACQNKSTYNNEIKAEEEDDFQYINNQHKVAINDDKAFENNSLDKENEQPNFLSDGLNNQIQNYEVDYNLKNLPALNNNIQTNTPNSGKIIIQAKEAIFEKEDIKISENLNKSPEEIVSSLERLKNDGAVIYNTSLKNNGNCQSKLGIKEDISSSNIPYLVDENGNYIQNIVDYKKENFDNDLVNQENIEEKNNL